MNAGNSYLECYPTLFELAARDSDALNSAKGCNQEFGLLVLGDIACEELYNDVFFKDRFESGGFDDELFGDLSCLLLFNDLYANLADDPTLPSTSFACPSVPDAIDCANVSFLNSFLGASGG